MWNTVLSISSGKFSEVCKKEVKRNVVHYVNDKFPNDNFWCKSLMEENTSQNWPFGWCTRFWYSRRNFCYITGIGSLSLTILFSYFFAPCVLHCAPTIKLNAWLRLRYVFLSCDHSFETVAVTNNECNGLNKAISTESIIYQIQSSYRQLKSIS